VKYTELLNSIVSDIKDSVGDLWSQLTEQDLEVLRDVAGDFAREAVALAASTTDAERNVHKANLEHLKAQTQIRLASVGVKVERQNREWLIRLIGTALKVVATMA
jgi:FixJ family two-component response regulator